MKGKQIKLQPTGRTPGELSGFSIRGCSREAGGEETVQVNIFLASAGSAIDLGKISGVTTVRQAQWALYTSPPAIL